MAAMINGLAIARAATLVRALRESDRSLDSATQLVREDRLRIAAESMRRFRLRLYSLARVEGLDDHTVVLVAALSDETLSEIEQDGFDG